MDRQASRLDTQMKEGFLRGRCPKCGGNVYLDRDHYGWHEECLQCGYAHDLQTLVEPAKVARVQESWQTAE